VSLADTLSGVENPTVKGLPVVVGRRGPPALPKGLPVARSLDDGGMDLDQTPLLLPEISSVPSRPKNVDLAAYFARRRRAPVWLWIVAAIGAILAAAMAVIAWKVGW
jgi:hypothetical protein